MRRLLVVLACAAVLTSQLSAQVDMVRARLGGELTAMPGSTFLVPVLVDMTASGGQSLGSYTARVTWDPAHLQLCVWCDDESLRGNFPWPEATVDSAAFGIFKFAAAAPLGATGVITLLSLPFVAVDTIGSPIHLEFTEMSAAGTFANLLPILETPADGAYCPARGRWGDVDRDGQSNSRDALMVLSRVVGLQIDSLADATLGDVDADGRITSRDALVILSYAVGFEVPGQRVLLPAAGVCGTGSARTLSITPGAAELVVGQQLQLVAWATDSAGRAVAVQSVTWRSSDPAVAAVEGSGIVGPRSPGTAVVTAELGPGVRASATITVVARRRNWYVDLRAVRSPIQLGTQEYPFEHPFGAFSHVAEGDTVRVAPGTYLFGNSGQLSVGAVIMGGTHGDSTTRPVFRGPDNGSYIGLWLQGGNRTEVHNVALLGFDEAIELDGVRSFVMEDGRVGRSYYGIYSCTGVPMDTVRIERSVFLGDSVSRTGYAMYYSGCADPVTALVTVVRDSKIRFWYDAIYLYGADSLAVVGSVISDNAGDGIYLSQEYSERPALYVARSSIERNTYGAVSGYSFRRVVIDTSVIRQAGAGSTIDVGGPYSGPLMELYLHGDAIYVEGQASDYNWLDADYADSVVVDGTTVRFPADTASFWVWGYVEADVAKITNSRFLNAGQGDVFIFWGRKFLADGDTVTGCAVAGCTQANGFELNLSGAGASSSVLNSSFSRIAYPIYAEGAGSVHEARFNSIDSARIGIKYYNVDSVTVTDNAIRRVYGVSGVIGAGIKVENLTIGSGRGPSLVARDTVDCGAALEYHENGLDLNNGAYVIDGNVVDGCREGIYLGSSRAGSLVQRNRVRNSIFGIDLYQSDTLTVTVDTNAVSATDSAAVQMFYGRVRMRANRIENNTRLGFYVPYGSGSYTHTLDSNAFKGNGSYSVHSSYDLVDATGNWWGLDGVEPNTTGAETVFGNVTTTSPLASAPPAASLPLAPPALGPAAARSPVVAAGAPAPERTAERPARTTRARVREMRPLPASAASSPERLARLQAQHDREAGRWRAKDERRAEHEARRAARQAAGQRQGGEAPPRL